MRLTGLRLYFTDKQAYQVLRGVRTQIRLRYRPTAKNGDIVSGVNSRGVFGSLRVLRVFQQRPRDMRGRDVEAEGCESLGRVLDILSSKTDRSRMHILDTEFWVVQFCQA